MNSWKLEICAMVMAFTKLTSMDASCKQKKKVSKWI